MAKKHQWQHLPLMVTLSTQNCDLGLGEGCEKKPQNSPVCAVATLAQPAMNMTQNALFWFHRPHSGIVFFVILVHHNLG